MTVPTSVPPPGAVLPCGTEVDALVDQIHAGRTGTRDEHQRHCPHCRAALAQYEPIFAPVRTLAAEPVRAPSSSIDQTLARLRRGRADDPEPWQVDVGRGRTRVAERVVVACARRAAEDVPGVHVALVRASSDAGVALQVTVAAAWGQNLRALGDRVRREVAAEVAEQTGVVATSVSAVIDTVVGSSE